ncbi:SpoIIE family protein phosphatase [Kitasatospora sp. NPDC052896]|uniref:SpoIIE family protein phosphatase n=1 Tax=Kitasatospora sp. NPDC052896 TaxID=3364061 RepID=UPI0037C5D7B5
MQSTDAYGCVAYLRSPDDRSLLLSAAAGVPVSLLGGFRRLSVRSPLPIAAAYRSGRTVSLSGAEETLRRFPQLLVGLPYAFATVCVPVTAGGERLGVLCAFWRAGKDAAAPNARRHLRTIANRLGAALAAGGGPAAACSTRTPTIVELPALAGPAASVGLFDWDLATDTVAADARACAVFGLADPAAFDGRAETLADRLHPDDRPAFHSIAARARADGAVRAVRLRVLPDEAGGPPWPIELWGRVPGPAGPASRPGERLVGAVLDTRTGAAAAGAVERLRHGVFALDPDGWITHTNHITEALLGSRREDLLGRHPWEALPWLADPAYEDRYRAAMLSQQPTSFLACRPPDRWLAFSLYPDAHGVTGTVVPAPPPALGPVRVQPDAAPPAAAPEPVPPAGLGGMYHLLQLASVLTQAVTVREVCETVAELILPAFGGQQLAVYVARDSRLHLALEVGYPEGFLDRFEGIPMRARVPGVETLSSGTPIFFESPEALAAAYPGLPLDERSSWAFLPLIASGHPVGSCILGFDEPRRFTPEDRGVLTALGGLIAQALERARLYDTEFALARGLQHALLPHRMPQAPGLVIAARYLPGTVGMEIGGDWYDVIPTTRGLTLVIGDVEGHSVAAAATMGQLRSAVRAFTSCGLSPDEVMEHTDRLLAELGPGLLASCLLVELESAEPARPNGTARAARAVRAGHLPPLLRHADGRAEVLDLPGGPLLGIDTGGEFPVSKLELPPGSVLALYTDGLVEEPGIEIDLGVDRLRVALAHGDAGSLEELADRLVGDARRSAHRADDVALLLALARGAE